MRVALLGGGNWGKNHARVLSSLGVLSAIVDTDPKGRAILQAEYPNVKVYEHQSKISAANTDAVVVATPASNHFETARASLLGGLDVLVEKPLTLSVNEAEELVKLAREKQRILMVGHLLLYQPAIELIARYLNQKELGRVYSVHQERVNLGRARTVENALWSLGVHDIAVLLHLLQAVPTDLKAVGHSVLQAGIEDDVYLHLTFPQGVAAHIRSSWLWPERRRTMCIVGEKGMLVFDEIAGTVTHHRKRINSKLEAQDDGAEVILRELGDPLRVELSHFLDCIKGRLTPKSDGVQGLEVVRILNKASTQLASVANDRKSAA